MKILILGGTTEARELAGRLCKRGDIGVILSLAGRTARPRDQGAPTRVGGFGGAVGLARYLRQENISILIDATHPYAATISANAADAASETGLPFLALRRAPWENLGGDDWREVENAAEAIAALGVARCCVFLALGRQEVAPFTNAPQHTYLVRSVDPIDPPLAVPNVTYVTARGPFSEADDRELLEQHRIEKIVAKNSGGDASYGKIAAARTLGIPLIMLRRPVLPDVHSAASVEDALAWCDHALTTAASRGV